MVVVTMRRVDGLFDLLRAHLPTERHSDGDFEDWTIVAPALLAIAADLLEGVLSSPPPRGRVRAETFARNLSEYAITFAWLAAADPEERSRRLKSLVRDEYREREKAERKLAEQIGGRSEYKRFFDPETDRPGGPLPMTLLDDSNRARLEALKGDASIPALPNALDMAFAADKKWMPEIDLVAHNPFVLVYFTLFTGSSFVTHPSVTSIAKVVVGNPPNLVVGLPEPLGESETPYGQAYLAYVNALLVASRALGWPKEEDVRGVIDRA